MIIKSARRLGLFAALATCALSAGTALASETPAWSYQLVYTADVMGAVAGDSEHAGRYLDNIDLIFDGDLEKAVGWRGATAHLYLLNNSGGRPNDVVGALQGVDNIEVERARLRLYELWVEQRFAGDHASVRAGLYDLNSEFYATDASGLLIAPPFGIGSEFASTGPNGPSIFPLTALAVRLKLGDETGPYAQAALLDAHAGGLNDPDHLEASLDRGGIAIAEAGYRGRTHLGLGGWTYTRRQDDLNRLTPQGEPQKTHAYGGYLLAEGLVWASGDDHRLSAFFRAGASEGRTTPFSGGWQAGLLAEGVTPGRPKSAASLGVEQAFLSSAARGAARNDGGDPATAEGRVEATYSDTVGRLSIQPDLQLIHHPGGDHSRNLALVAAMRFTFVLH
jgi:porin